MRWLGIVVALTLVAADGPLRSGLQPKQRPGPYSALVCVGPQRGQQHCYVCEAEGRPVVIVFARSFSDPLGKLVHRLDKLMLQHKDVELRSWVTFLGDDQTALDAKVVDWGKKHATGGVPLAVFEDKVGPPAYLLAAEADVTVLVSNKQRVVANFAFRAGELNDGAVDAVAKTVAKTAAK